MAARWRKSPDSEHTGSLSKKGREKKRYPDNRETLMFQESACLTKNRRVNTIDILKQNVKIIKTLRIIVIFVLFLHTCWNKWWNYLHGKEW